VDAAIRTLRIIVAALMSGLATLAAVAVVVGPLSRPIDSTTADAMLLALVAVASTSTIAYLLLRRSLTAGLARRASELRLLSDPSSLALEPYRRFVITGGALIEAPALFGVVTYLVTGAVAGLGAVAVALALMAAHLPSAEQLRNLAVDASRSQ
jgi:hypothetical protein